MRPPSALWFRNLKIALFVVTSGALVVVKWQLASGYENSWPFTILLIGVTLGAGLEIAERQLRKRAAEPGTRLDYNEPGGGPPGWQWVAGRATWRAPDPPP